MEISCKCIGVVVVLVLVALYYHKSQMKDKETLKKKADIANLDEKNRERVKKIDKEIKKLKDARHDIIVGTGDDK